MSRSLRRGALAATAAAFSLVSLGACAAGHDAPTLQVKPDNAAVTKGDIKVQNALVITQEKDKKGPAAVSATVFNNGTKEQTLDAITLPGSKAVVTLKPAGSGSKVVIPAGGSVLLGGKGNASAVIAGGESVVDGNVQKIVFQLSTTGDVELEGFVVPATGMYEGYGPTAAPAAGATPSGSPSASPSGSASATPSGSPSASASHGAAASGSPSTGTGH
ncbi:MULTISPECIES: DUF461 domain-containing protein [unclassified Streptomyces]|uniref:DUF461 domain-containing protein n=1 Tax=unclassified Streptomyces TaxID=2593676 RepID=UPI00202F5436|nr:MULTISPECIES: DUF461 domain-containing protein [unclassified Streptomyces]MCM1971019.1 DUF461 domain-containing protein [Streptomyces sp. G1]MCX5124269.1 DUF461 domain-containing protein [Streptomyces sp. NBC_00347]MCX5297517.1 DUF461 domain-containing protein [Streptomyces sp. NBC_00193]